MQIGMTDILQQTHKTYISKVQFDIIGNLHQIIFIRKKTGQPSNWWYHKGVHYRREGSPSHRRAMRAALALNNKVDIGQPI